MGWSYKFGFGEITILDFREGPSIGLLKMLVPDGLSMSETRFLTIGAIFKAVSIAKPGNALRIEYIERINALFVDCDTD